MNLIETFQDLVAQVPDLLQPLIVALAGAIPFIEGEGAVTIGILGGIHPVIAVIAAVIGNFICVAVLVLLSARTRKAVVTMRRSRVAVPAGATAAEAAVAETPAASESARQTKFRNALERYGVPGVSLLGPLLLPTQFTATMLAAAGVATARILFWQGLAIVAWSTAFALIVTGVVSAAV